MMSEINLHVSQIEKDSQKVRLWGLGTNRIKFKMRTILQLIPPLLVGAALLHRKILLCGILPTLHPRKTA